jgi:hypothetical protein
MTWRELLCWLFGHWRPYGLVADGPVNGWRCRLCRRFVEAV